MSNKSLALVFPLYLQTSNILAFRWLSLDV